MEPTLDQAIETYKRTVRDEPNRETWPGWVLAVSNSLAAGEWLGGDRYPAFAEEVFKELMKEGKKISMADSK